MAADVTSVTKATVDGASCVPGQRSPEVRVRRSEDGTHIEGGQLVIYLPLLELSSCVTDMADRLRNVRNCCVPNVAKLSSCTQRFLHILVNLLLMSHLNCLCHP